MLYGMPDEKLLQEDNYYLLQIQNQGQFVSSQSVFGISWRWAGAEGGE